MLRLTELSKVYPGGVVGLHPTSLELDAGGRLVLLGPSGSGKSTLLRLIAGLETPTTGTVHWKDARLDRLPPHRRGVAFTAQRPALYPQLTVAEQLPASPRRAEAVAMLRLESLLARLPATLSGGEKQRVVLAKLLCRDAPLWLLDEPFGSLDPVFRAEFRHDLHLLAEVAGATMIIVTHDPTDAPALGRRVGVLGGGKLQRFGTPEELHARPGNRFTAFCLGAMSLVDGVVRGGEFSGWTFHSGCGHLTVPLPLKRAVAGEWPSSLTLGLRPEDLRPVPPGTTPGASEVLLSGWPVVFTEPFGSGRLVTVARGRTRLRGMGSPGTPPGIGTSTDWVFPIDRCEWFPTL